jgi:hypothetical protein
MFQGEEGSSRHEYSGVVIIRHIVRNRIGCPGRKSKMPTARNAIAKHLQHTLLSYQFKGSNATGCHQPYEPQA